MVVAMHWLAPEWWHLGIRQVKVPPVLFWGWKVVEITRQHVQRSPPAGRGQSWAWVRLSEWRRTFPRKAVMV